MSMLSFIYLFADIDDQRGLEVSRTIAEKYPNNYDYQIHYVESLLRVGEMKMAKKVLNKLNALMFELTPMQQRWFTSYLNYAWGTITFYWGKTKKLWGSWITVSSYTMQSWMRSWPMLIC